MLSHWPDLALATAVALLIFEIAKRM